MTRRARILMLIPELGYGGAERSFIQLANTLAKTFDVTITVFRREYGGAYSVGGLVPKPPVVVLDEDNGSASRMRRWLDRWQKVRRLKKEHHATISFLSGTNALNALAGRPARTICGVQGSRIYDPLPSRWVKFCYAYLLEPPVLVLSRRIVVVSHGLINEIPFPRLFARKCVVIPPQFGSPATVSRTRDFPAEKRRRLEGQIVITAVGRLSREKGFDHLIAVFARLNRRVPGLKLLLVGDGPEMDRLRSLCAELRLPVDSLEEGTGSVIFAGYQGNVARLLKISSIGVLSSRTEGFSLALLEGLAAGLVMVAADVPWGARSILYETPPKAREPYPTTAPKEADYGILMPRIDLEANHQVWADTLAGIIGRLEICRPIAERGRASVARFHYEAVGRRWVALLDEVMGGRKDSDARPEDARPERDPAAAEAGETGGR